MNNTVFSYFLSFAWGICILLSFVGWGSMLSCLLFPKRQIDWGQQAAWGVAFSVVVGGFLNVTRTISPRLILIYVFLGLTYYLIRLSRNKQSITSTLSREIINSWKDKPSWIGFVVILSLIFLHYGGSVSDSSFNLFDDYQSYFVFPNKMLQAGSMGRDPFSGRRLISSLGGQSFLCTFILSVRSEINLGIIDCGLGLIITVGLLLGLFKELGTSRRVGTFIIFLLLIFVPKKINITSHMIAMSLFISLFRTLDWRMLRLNHLLANSFIISSVMAAVFAVKSNMIPACGIMFVLSYFFYIAESDTKWRASTEFVGSVVLVFVMLLPWMISLNQSSGTFLYPLLGEGYYGTADGTMEPPGGTFTTFQAIKVLEKVAIRNRYFISLMLLGFASIRLRPWQSSERKVSLALLISAVLGALITAFATDGTNRYLFPFLAPAVTILLAIIMTSLGDEKVGKFRDPQSLVIALMAASVLILYSFSSSIDTYSNHINNIKFGLQRASLVSKDEIHQYALLQESIPEEEVILAHLNKPFLLNFKQNSVFIIDSPGTASPPPGMPFFKGSEALADYITSQDIRYLVFNDPIKDPIIKSWGEVSYSSWIGRLKRHYFDLQHNLTQLAKTRKKLYDNDRVIALDLLRMSKD